MKHPLDTMDKPRAAGNFSDVAYSDITNGKFIRVKPRKKP
jgi:hypothetical protein